MLNFLKHFIVPGVDYVTIFHDDQDPQLFYMLPEHPSIIRRDDGKPAFFLMTFARDFTLLASESSAMPAGETEGGLLSLSTELTVSEEDQQKIRSYIGGGMTNVLRPRLEGNRIRLMLGGSIAANDVKLTYPTWVDGSVAFHMVPSAGETWVKASEGSEKPSLVRNNVASYQALLGQEGVRLFRGAIEQGVSPGSVDYTLKFVARIPNLKVHVWGNSHDVYNEIKEHCTVTEDYGSSVYRFPQVSSLEEMRNISSNLHIEYNQEDFRTGSAEGGEEAKAVQTLVLELVKQMVLDRFLGQRFEPGLKAEKLGTDPFAHGDVPKMTGGNQLWLKDFSQTMDVAIDFTFEGSSNFIVERHPNGTLSEMLPIEEITSLMTEADLSDPLFTLLDVPVRVTADFERDPIAAITVFLDYDQQDELGLKERKVQTEEFQFESNDDVFYFRTVMARRADGSPKDEYTYRTKVTYKASSTGEASEPVTTRDRNLIIGYDRLNCVSVAAYWGAIPADAVQQVQIAFRYPGVDLPSATADVVLRIDAPQANWFTYTGKEQSTEYEYDVTFFMADGQRIAVPTQKSSTQRLIVNAPFQDKLSATFVPQGAFPAVASIVVTTKYADGDYQAGDVHSFTNSAETWEWSIDLRDRSKRDFTYKVDVTYADGSSSPGEFLPGTEGTILVGDVARDMLTVEIVPTLLDMTKWKLVIVRLWYDDGAGTTAEHNLQLTAAPADPAQLKWTIPVKDAAKRSFFYQIQAFGTAGEKHDVPRTESTDPLLVLEF